MRDVGVGLDVGDDAQQARAEHPLQARSEPQRLRLGNVTTTALRPAAIEGSRSSMPAPKLTSTGLW